MEPNTYTPGVCNIGPAEIKARRRFGWIGLFVGIVILAALFWLHADRWWRLVLFIPAMASASGFLQAYYRFCTGFARVGVYNFGPIGGSREKVTDDAAKTKDLAQGTKISRYALLIGLGVAIIAVLI